ncbi:MAG TPA: DUF6734 family protein, partial [Puia sp.]
MKILHSFWSKPAFHEQQEYENSRKFGGWLNYKYFLLSSCYSCLTARRHHKAIDLYTDSKGYDLFIDMLNLPYNDVSTSLDELTDKDHQLWVLGKLRAIEQQRSPFIHIDNDVFLWDRLPLRSDSSFLIAQGPVPMP